MVFPAAPLNKKLQTFSVFEDFCLTGVFSHSFSSVLAAVGRQMRILRILFKFDTSFVTSALA